MKARGATAAVNKRGEKNAKGEYERYFLKVEKREILMLLKLLLRKFF